MIQNLWDGLDPNKKRWIVVAGGTLALVGVVALFSSDTKEENRKQHDESR